MIKVIAFDLVGVLVSESDIELSQEEDRLERMYGDNLNDNDYLDKAKDITNDDIESTTYSIFDKLYIPRDIDIFTKLKEKYGNVKLVVATNHVSYVRKYIEKTFDNADDIIISAEIGMIKPNKDFYEYILNKYNINPDELLFLDDSIRNIDGALSLGIKTIKVDKGMDLYDEIVKYIK